jgi:hypothetical protein
MEIGSFTFSSILYAFLSPSYDWFKNLIFFPVAALNNVTPIEKISALNRSTSSHSSLF